MEPQTSFINKPLAWKNIKMLWPFSSQIFDKRGKIELEEEVANRLQRLKQSASDFSSRLDLVNTLLNYSFNQFLAQWNHCNQISKFQYHYSGDWTFLEFLRDLSYRDPILCDIPFSPSSSKIMVVIKIIFAHMRWWCRVNRIPLHIKFVQGTSLLGIIVKVWPKTCLVAVLYSSPLWGVCPGVLMLTRNRNLSQVL